MDKVFHYRSAFKYSGVRRHCSVLVSVLLRLCLFGPLVLMVIGFFCFPLLMAAHYLDFKAAEKFFYYLPFGLFPIIWLVMMVEDGVKEGRLLEEEKLLSLKVIQTIENVGYINGYADAMNAVVPPVTDARSILPDSFPNYFDPLRIEVGNLEEMDVSNFLSPNKNLPT